MKAHLLLPVICLILLAGNVYGQDTTKAQGKEYLGVLTLAEKYRDEKNWTQNDQAVVGEHFQRLMKFKNEGVVILAGRTQYETNNPDMMGLVIFYAKDDAAALQFMLDDPAVKNKIMLTKVHPYMVVLNKCD
jgi:uncharacterized protein